MIKKRLFTTLLAGALTVAMTFPSLAYDRSHIEIANGSMEKIVFNETFMDGGTYSYYLVPGKLAKFPGWHWVNGYCYYFTKPVLGYTTGDPLKNCVTPDGYIVDEFGRWTENGVAVHNDYGSVVIGTDQLYAGKSDQERWDVMRGLLEQVTLDYVYDTEYSTSLIASDSYVRANTVREGFSQIFVTLNTWDPTIWVDKTNIPYIWCTLSNKWNDNSQTYTLGNNELTERVIKILCGDHVGQELFNDIKAAADPCEGGTWSVPKLDENGNLIFIDSDHIETITIDHYSDGINFKYLDLNKWNGRLTDYGKVIQIKLSDTIEEVTKTPIEWELNICNP